MLFDPANPSSDELNAAYGLRDRLSEESVFQELAGVSTAADALDHLTVGIFDNPFDGATYSEDELADLGFQAVINRAEGERVATVDAYGQSSGAGVLEVKMHRYVRKSEDIQDAFLFFWDRTDALLQALATTLSTATCPRVQSGSLVIPMGPLRTSFDEEVAQGEVLLTQFVIPWGDNLGED